MKHHGRLNPKPWDQPFQYLTKATSISGEAVPFQTLPRNKIQGPTITLETTQIYIPRDAREYLRKTVVSIPYIQVQLSKFTVEDFNEIHNEVDRIEHLGNNLNTYDHLGK